MFGTCLGSTFRFEIDGWLSVADTIGGIKGNEVVWYRTTGVVVTLAIGAADSAEMTYDSMLYDISAHAL
jgi:hypothetical protein